MPTAEAVDHKVVSHQDWVLAPKGRNERDADGKMVDWVKRHDEYEGKSAASSCCHDEANA
jgi:predicted dithiol-disulfide oxidoreductase (DUF899 family)